MIFMYQQIKALPIDQQVETITRALVGIKSVNGTTGETEMAGRLEDIIRSFPYFKERPENVWTQKLENDPFGRKNVFAFLESGKPTGRTVIYHGHVDTVGIDDYGKLEPDALNPDALLDFFKSYDKDEEVMEDARTGDWLFGRGALDMKSGDAVHLCNLLYFSEHRERLRGNVLVMFNPVEENDHSGIMAATKELIRLKSERRLDYLAAINSDFVSPLYKDDQHRYIYTGAVGKLLGCFYIRGREAHVGETLSGIDPTLIAGKINGKLNNNMAGAEHIPGEVVLPPSCLFQRDQKAFYNVQTAGTSYLYFNYFLYERSPEDALHQLMRAAREACEETACFLAKQYKIFSNNGQLPDSPPGWSVEILSYGEYVERVRAKGIDVAAVQKQVVQKDAGRDLRLRCYTIIEALEELDGDKRPKVIVFFAPPYCPHNYLKEDVEKEAKCDRIIDQVLEKNRKETGGNFSKKKFFPYLSDSSYLAINETEAETREIVRHFPGWGDVYAIPLDNIRALNIPVVNMGVYGKKAHTWTERVYKPYSFGVLPKVIRDMTEAIMLP